MLDVEPFANWTFSSGLGSAAKLQRSNSNRSSQMMTAGRSQETPMHSARESGSLWFDFPPPLGELVDRPQHEMTLRASASNRTQWRIFCAVAIVLILHTWFCEPSAWAQIAGGSISGTVKDPSGA